MAVLPRVLCIGGSDPGMGAGLQMDERVVRALGCEFVGVTTLETVQDKEGLRSVTPRDPEQILSEVNEALQNVAAVKTGALGTEAIVRSLYRPFRDRPELPLVVDPVAAASRVAESGFVSDAGGGTSPGPQLLTSKGEAALFQGLAGIATVVTPNQLEYEASKYSECRTVLLKGGHAEGDEVCDELLIPGEQPKKFCSPRISGVENAHGTGCAFASAVAVFLASGLALEHACAGAHAAMQQWLSDGFFS
ncbi:MAG: bifunctional hydroxymethylpyrimidine kinase/phosphomethylpyrimidine kinase [Planctomycetota bacterium]|nr:bifunctional hydroxymethylpyrimidine kinase/phosphomethylpyrimidine kinase [Planctomycetota bacterium]MDP6941956.1 bifunctional hydroxymethylpyrimidine kinase/phosphomethylpyrimidine kinase [Planctomycetota bacterium]